MKSKPASSTHRCVEVDHGWTSGRPSYKGYSPSRTNDICLMWHKKFGKENVGSISKMTMNKDKRLYCFHDKIVFLRKKDHTLMQN